MKSHQFSHSKIILLIISLCSISLSHAGTYYRLTVPTQSGSYCETMPFYFVNEGDTTQPFVPITVNQAVKISFTNPYFWFWSKPVSGMAIFSPKGLVKPIKQSEKEYQYQLTPLKAGEVYHLRGTLKSPSDAFKICVTPL